MKKQELKNLKLNKSKVSSLAQKAVTGGLLRTFPSKSCFFDCPPSDQTGSGCLTGYGTNCQ